jgi:hypothetical protein
MVYLGLSYLPPSSSSGTWWIERPAWVALSTLVTVPIVLVGSRVLGGQPESREGPEGTGEVLDAGTIE